MKNRLGYSRCFYINSRENFIAGSLAFGSEDMHLACENNDY